MIPIPILRVIHPLHLKTPVKLLPLYFLEQLLEKNDRIKLKSLISKID